MNREIVVDTQVSEEASKVREIIRDEIKYAPRGGRTKGYPSLYEAVLAACSHNMRNTPNQIRYLEAYEQSLGIFRACSLELRKTMDVKTLEQRLAAQKTLQAQRESLAQQQSEQKELSLHNEITDAVFFSNRYALAFAGNVGLALLDGKKADVKNLYSFGTQGDAHTNRDYLTAELAQTTRIDLEHLAAKTREASNVVSEKDLHHLFECIFTSWINQFSYATFADVTQKRGVAGVTLRCGTYSMNNGEFKQKHDVVIVDDNLIKAKKEDVMGNTEFGSILWSSMLKLACYDHERKTNPFSPPSVIYTYSEPGAGKTFVSNAFMQSFGEFCKEKGIACWLLAHSTTDYASHYQNKTANELAALGSRIRDFPGIVVMYAADIDNIFQSRKDERMTAEQQQTQSVYFKMFDGSMIPKNGKFMAIMDSNYVHGIDDATKSRIFDVVLELKRFDKPEHFAALIERKLTKGLETKLLAPESWNEVGSWLLASPLSNREIDHVTNQLRGKLLVPESLVTAPFDEKVTYRNEQLQKLFTEESIIAAFQAYIDTRMEIDRKAHESLFREDHDRFVNALSQKHVPTIASAPSGA